MRFSEIIKKAWNITWRYRALWVLGLFAGVTGSSSGGGSSYRAPSSSGSGTSNPFANVHADQVLPALQRFLPVLIIVGMGLFAFGILWWVFSIAARGGLVYAVNEIESGRPFTLGASWRAGFSRWWRLLGLSILLALPVFLLLLLVVFGVIAPLLPSILSHTSPNGAVFVPVCGVVAIGIPALIVVGLILGIMYVLGVRFVMLHGLGVIDSARESWLAFRTRFKDTALMYLINLGLNIAAGIVLAIPLVIIGVAVAIPAVISAVAGHWAQFAAALGLAFAIVTPISLLFTAIWGTFTSSLWTIFYRRLTGMEVLAPIAPAYPPPSYPPPPSAGFGPPSAPPAWAPPPPPGPPAWTPPAPPRAPSPPAPPAPHAPGQTAPGQTEGPEGGAS